MNRFDVLNIQFKFSLIKNYACLIPTKYYAYLISSLKFGTNSEKVQFN